MECQTAQQLHKKETRKDNNNKNHKASTAKDRSTNANQNAPPNDMHQNNERAAGSRTIALTEASSHAMPMSSMMLSSFIVAGYSCSIASFSYC